MHGNVWEWVWDWFGEFDAEPASNPTGAAASDFRVLRGGSWVDPPEHARSVLRGGFYPGYWLESGGFRVVRP